MSIILSVGTGVGAAAAALGLGWKYFAKPYIDTAIREGSEIRLKDHQQKLDAMNIAAQFEYQKRLVDINLYTERKHQVYPEIYALVLRCESGLSALAKLETVDNLDDLRVLANGNDIDLLYERRMRQNLYLKPLDENKEHVQVKLTAKFASAVQKLRRGVVEERLYMSDAVVELVDKLNSQYSSWGIAPGNNSRSIVEARENLKNAMRRELGHEYKGAE